MARIDGKKILLTEKIKLNKNIKHNIEIIVDRLILTSKIAERLAASIELGLKLGNGVIIIETAKNKDYLFISNSGIPFFLKLNFKQFQLILREPFLPVQQLSL